MDQLASIFWNNWHAFLTGGLAIATVLLAYLNLRARDELPEISARLSGHTSEAHNSHSQDHNPHLFRRHLHFRMPLDSSPSKWETDEVRIAKSRHEWIAVPGEGEWNDFGEFEGYALGGDWTDRLRYDPPVDDEIFLLHPDAPENLRFKFRIRLRSRLRTKRKVDVIPSPPS